MVTFMMRRKTVMSPLSNSLAVNTCQVKHMCKVKKKTVCVWRHGQLGKGITVSQWEVVFGDTCRRREEKRAQSVE